MLIARRANLDIDLTAHAIVWRPIRYFTNYVRTEEDGLDSYRVATFDYGNDFRFDIRNYSQHPKMTISIYLPDDLKSISVINRALEAVLQSFTLPTRSIAWRRGQPFEFGVLHRQQGDRLREAEARILFLKIAARRLRRFATVEDIKREIPHIYPLSEQDLKQSTTRRRESLWEQVIRNVISHGYSAQGLFERGYAVRIDNGLQVTQEGLDYLKSIGFSA